MLEHGGAQDGKSQPGVVGPGVVVDEPGDKPVGAQGGEVGGELLSGDAVVALANPPATGKVVHPQRCRVRPCCGPVDDPAFAENRNKERKRLDEMWCVLQQETTLIEALTDEAEIVLLEVAQSAMHHLGGL